MHMPLREALDCPLGIPSLPESLSSNKSLTMAVLAPSMVIVARMMGAR